MNILRQTFGFILLGVFGGRMIEFAITSPDLLKLKLTEKQEKCVVIAARITNLAVTILLILFAFDFSIALQTYALEFFSVAAIAYLIGALFSSKKSVATGEVFMGLHMITVIIGIAIGESLRRIHLS